MTEEQEFWSKFFDVKKHKPQKGQIMVVYEAIASLVKGAEKQQLVNLLCQPDKAIPVSQMMKNVFNACEEDSVSVPLQMLQDLREGMSIDKVLKKPYKFKMQMFFYTWPECVPNDPHWKSIS